jgi:cilia- and flagella-associated protein 251
MSKTELKSSNLAPLALNLQLDQLQSYGILTSVKTSRTGIRSIPSPPSPSTCCVLMLLGRFIVANDEFKFKEFNADSKQCRKTTLAPTFGGPPNKLLALKFNGAVGHYAYSTAERIVGLGCLPLTGDPTQVMGLVAHPSRISSICVSNDGRFLFTAGGSDLTASMFSIDYSAFANKVEGGALSAFLDLLEGGSGGELHNDIIDYFYLCQLRTQGETIMEDRAISGRIPVEEIASLVRAIGFYPTEEEIENMVNEVDSPLFPLTHDC